MGKKIFFYRVPMDNKNSLDKGLGILGKVY
jgi:hypothetical protein